MKKGQAALEFLTTYGWAFLVIVIMISALAYFGILSPSQFLPERCNFPSEFICVDYQLEDAGSAGDHIRVKLNHNMGKTIQVASVLCVFPDGDNVTGSLSSNTFGPKDVLEMNCTASSNNALNSGEKQKVEVTLAYNLTTGGYEHYAPGEIYADVI